MERIIQERGKWRHRHNKAYSRMERTSLLLTLPATAPPSSSSSSLFLPISLHVHYQTHHPPPQLCTTHGTKYHNWKNFHAKNFNSDSFSFEQEDDDDDDVESNVLGRKKKRKKKKRKWLSDEIPKVEEEDEDLSVLEEFIDSIWIFKVFRSYGWALPPIILSLLLATGLKAFLIVLALPLGQSAFSFAFQKMSGRPKQRKKRKFRTSNNQFRTRRYQSTKASTNADMEEEQQESRETRKRKTWADANVDSVDNESDAEVPSFGGWDELDTSTRMYRRPRVTDESKRRMMNDRVTRKNRSQTPLLLRLLVAAFPFLASWTKLFW